MQKSQIQFIEGKISTFFKFANIQKLAKKNKVIQRKPKKITPKNFIISHWELLSKNSFSYDNWAVQLGLLSNQKVSGQAIWKRMNKEMVSLIKDLLNKSFEQKLDKFIDSQIFKPFNQVYIQDATHFSLPTVLETKFAGSFSRYRKTATAKIQATFNIKKGAFSSFKVNSFRDNDQSDSPRIIEQIEESDLVIRDLGYFVISAFKKICSNNAFFLSRLKPNVAILSPLTLEPIDILSMMKNKKEGVDIPVLLGKKEQMACRLVVLPVPEKVANERRRKAKADRNKQANHGKKYLQILSYTIYITNVDKKVWSANDVAKAYQSRWYIEILFKSWKSHLQIKNVIPEKYINEIRAEYLFYSSLLMINVLVHPFFLKVSERTSKENKYVSIIKICDFVSKNMSAFLRENNMEALIDSARYFCLYDSRNDRINSIQLLLLS